MHALMASPAVQEKLSNEGRCVVPKQVVDGLAGDPHLKSNPFISASMHRFMDTSTRKRKYGDN